MANEVIDIAVDSKTVSVAGTPEAITAREIACSSVYLVPISSNTNEVYVVDSSDDAKKIRILSGGITLPIGNPALIKIDVDTNGEGADWMAI